MASSPKRRTLPLAAIKAIRRKAAQTPLDKTPSAETLENRKLLDSAAKAAGKH